MPTRSDADPRRVLGVGQAADQDQSTPHFEGSGGADGLQLTEALENEDELAHQLIEQFHFHFAQVVSKGKNMSCTCARFVRT